MSEMSKKRYIEINKLRGLFPRSINVRVERSKDGGFFAVVKTFPGCITQADSLSELIEMVNDVVRTHFEIPGKFLPYMPTYLPPLKVAQQFDLFPITERKTEIRLELPNPRETVAR